MLRNRLTPTIWLTSLLLLAGCNNDGGGGTGSGSNAPGANTPTAPGLGTGAGGAGRGPAPVDLQSAGDFVVLAQMAIADVPPSAVTGNVGMSPSPGTGIGISCAEVTGGVYAADATGPAPCSISDPNRLTAAISDSVVAFDDAAGRAPDYNEHAAGNIGGLNLGPATYRWSTAVTIPASLTLTGTADDVWIFQIAEDLIVAPGVSITLAGGAQARNVFWQSFAADLGAAARFSGVLLSETAIVLRAGASVNGRLMSGTMISLDKNAVRQP